MSENILLYLVGSAVAVIVWLVRLESKVYAISAIGDKNEAKVSGLDGHIRILQIEMSSVSTSLRSIESELREIKEFITKDGFEKLRGELVAQIAHELRRAV